MSILKMHVLRLDLTTIAYGTRGSQLHGP